MKERASFQTEMTNVGEQMLVLGVKPITTKTRLEALASAPLLPRKPQKPCNVGLFDEDARNQLSLF